MPQRGREGGREGESVCVCVCYRENVRERERKGGGKEKGTSFSIVPGLCLIQPPAKQAKPSAGQIYFSLQ